MALTNPSAATALLVDKNNNPMLGAQQTVVAEITDSTGGTANGSTVDLSTLNIGEIQDDIATIAAKINEIVQVLAAHGLIADS